MFVPVVDGEAHGRSGTRSHIFVKPFALLLQSVQHSEQAPDFSGNQAVWLDP